MTTAFGISGYLVRAHHVHLLREAAMAHGTQRFDRLQDARSVTSRLLGRVLPRK